MSDSRQRRGAGAVAASSPVLLDAERCYRAVASRDARFDGQFVTAVRTTGIYCRPVLPGGDPEAGQRRVLPTAAAAQLRGFRACRRCLPDAVPGSPEWNVRADLAGRAMRLIGDGVVERDGVPGLAAAPRLLRAPPRPGAHRRAGRRSAGAGPRAPRAHGAAAGRDHADGDGGRRVRGRVRQRAAVQRHRARGVRGAADHAAQRGRTRTRSRSQQGRSCCGCPSGRRSTAPGCWRSSRRGPWVASRTWTAARTGGRCGYPAGRRWWRSSCRSCRTSQRSQCRRRGDRLCEDVRGPARTARHRRSPQDGARAHGCAGPRRRATPMSSPHCASPTRGTSAPAVARLRRLLDLDADPVAVDAALAADPALAPGVAAVPGIRLPGTVDAGRDGAAGGARPAGVGGGGPHRRRPARRRTRRARCRLRWPATVPTCCSRPPTPSPSTARTC